MSMSEKPSSLSSARFRFGTFELDVADRQLWAESRRVELSARYLDALILLVSESSRLVEKDRFFSEVWNDVVVSDSALSQCIKELRRVLDDDASNPRFIQTVPRHGYRFVATVKLVSPEPPSEESTSSRSFRALQLWAAGTAGGAMAGLFGGMLYGFSLSSAEAGVGTLSTLLVLLGLNVILGFTGAAGISAGIAGSTLIPGQSASSHGALLILGAGFGGLAVGTGAKMLGMDAFNLFLGRAPAGITGGLEGAALGIAVAVGLILAPRLTSIPDSWRSVIGGGTAGIVAGATIPLLGGHLLGGSLKLLADSFQESRLQVDAFATLVGGMEFGLSTEVVLAGIEGMLLCASVTGAIAWAKRRIS